MARDSRLRVQCRVCCFQAVEQLSQDPSGVDVLEGLLGSFCNVPSLHLHKEELLRRLHAGTV